MLFSNVVLLVHVPLKRSKDISLINEVVTRPPFNVEQFLVGDPILVRKSGSVVRGYREIFQFFSQHNNRLLREQGILRACWPKVGRCIEQMLLSAQEPW